MAARDRYSKKWHDRLRRLSGDETCEFLISACNCLDEFDNLVEQEIHETVDDREKCF